jgi:hypothetical protein
MAIRKHGFPAKAIEYLGTLEAGARVSGADLAAALGYEGASLAQVFKNARNEGLIECEREGNGFVWFLPDEGAADEPPEFNAALWADGDLVIYGATETADGGVMLNADQVAKVKSLIAWSRAQ